MARLVRDRFGTFPLSTDGVPADDRIRFLREGLGRLVRLDIEALPGVPLHADLTLRILPGLGIIQGRHGPLRIGRSPPLIADGNDDLVLLVRTGAGILLSNADIGTYEFSSSGNILALILPRTALNPLLGNFDASRRHPLLRNDALLMLEHYLSVMPSDQVLASPELGRAVVAYIHDLVALAVGAKRDSAEAAGGLPAARLSSIKADIAECLHRGCAITVGGLAARQRVTPRYIQLLFESEGTTLTQFVLRQRLARAYRMLTNPNLPDRAITAVAFDAGFGDLSYFIRSFRRAYGARPSEVRSSVAGAR